MSWFALCTTYLSTRSVKEVVFRRLSLIFTLIPLIHFSPWPLFWKPSKIRSAPALPRADTVQPANRPQELIVAVIDTGLDQQHPTFSGKLWVNPGESGTDKNGADKTTNGIDDDGNGHVDDVHGWNFANDNHHLNDHNGHGTHIAGIIAASPIEHRLMTLKYVEDSKLQLPVKNSQLRSPLRASVKAIHYAVKMGAKVINYSSGGRKYDVDEQQALEWARHHGVLVVAAAGNQGRNTDRHPFYPASYSLDNIVSVAASHQRRLLSFSNFGSQSVDLAAPGKSIYSTLPGGTHGRMSGTSQAAAFVTQKLLAVLAEPTISDLAPSRVLQIFLKKHRLKFSPTQKTLWKVDFSRPKRLVAQQAPSSQIGD